MYVSDRRCRKLFVHTFRAGNMPRYLWHYKVQKLKTQKKEFKFNKSIRRACIT